MSWLRITQSRVVGARILAALIVLGPVPVMAAEALVLRIDGAIGPATAEYVRQGLDDAARRRSGLVVMELDTPGGLESSTRDIVKAMLGAVVPIAAYVTPSGARAASAGTYILLAAQIAAMAPGTNIGAATPVQIGGDGDTSGKSGKSEVGLHQKMVNDSAAFIRSLAQLRGRNADWAERSVRNAATVSANEALSAGVVDVIAADGTKLLAQIDGRTVRVGQGEVRLDTKGMVTTVSSPSWRSRLLSFLADPQVAYILLTVGTYGIIAEMWMPGTVLPGLTGVICLLLAFYAFQMLPVDGTGLSLLLLGLVLMMAEVFVAGFGALGVAGIVAFVIGSIMLFDTGVPGYGVPWPLIAAVAGSFALLLTAAVILVVRNRRRLVAEGGEHLLREPAEVVDWHAGRGWVRVQGERWVATGPADLRVGDIVGIKCRNGLQLSIERQGSAQ